MPDISYILLAAAGIIFLGAFWQYNLMVRKKNRIQEAWATIDVELKKRFDLIPNLTKVIEGAITHEKTTLTEITQIRAEIFKMGKSVSPDTKRLALENSLSGMLPQLFMNLEKYPDLKTNVNFLDLQNTLILVEGHISASRRFYNSAVRDYNDLIQVLPGSLLAPIFGFGPAVFFDLADPDIKASVDNL